MRIFMVGLIAGILLAATVLLAQGDWYEYRVLDTRDDAIAFVNNNGWHVVPNQSDIRYLERPRLRLH